MPNKVELHQAFMWDCDECGQQNFCRAVTADITAEEREEAIRAFEGLDEWQDIPEGMGGDFLMAPERVKCTSCGADFETERHNEGTE